MPFGKCWLTLPVHLRSDTPWATWLSSICGVNLGGIQAQGFDPCSHPLLSIRTRTTFQSAFMLPEGVAAVQHVQLVPPQDGGSAVPLPHNCQRIIDAGGFARSPFSSDIT